MISRFPSTYLQLVYLCLYKSYWSWELPLIPKPLFNPWHTPERNKTNSTLHQHRPTVLFLKISCSKSGKLQYCYYDIKKSSSKLKLAFDFCQSSVSDNLLSSHSSWCVSINLVYNPDLFSLYQLSTIKQWYTIVALINNKHNRSLWKITL